ncbi:Stearoyl-CoA desaturase 5 [Halotydeus destructor]|nr:Stearoyl-CoA desaturase 5 [Halotydeus destructor]
MCPGPGTEERLEACPTVCQELDEYSFARKCRWFSVSYFNDKRTRYVFVNADKYGIVWVNCCFFVILHCLFAYVLWMCFEYSLYSAWVYCEYQLIQTRFSDNVFSGAAYCAGWLSGIGITAGAHRLWTHKSYTASLPLRIFLAVLFTMAGQNDIFTWSRDHRLHHKFTETDADPHNSRRGAFFAHVGWLLTKKHPDVLIKGRTIDHSDLMADPVVVNNKKYYVIWYLLFRVYIPSMIPAWLFDEELRFCIVGCLAQYIAGLHTTWFVNSAAHMFGDRPYNSKIQPRENLWVTLTAFGEGYHNFHHTFPWDYTIAEFGFSGYNPGKGFIDLMFKLGLASNLKRASPSLIAKTRARKTGHKWDHEFYLHDHPYEQPHQYSEGS